MKRYYYIFLVAITLFSCESSISDFQSKNFVKIFGSGYESVGRDIVELSEGGYLLLGTDLVDNSDYQVYICRVDVSGNRVWDNTFGLDDAKDEGQAIRSVADGFVVASTATDESGLVHSYITKIDMQGVVQWSQPIGKNTYSICVNDIATDGSSLYLAGYSDTLKAGKTDYFISKLDAMGNPVWAKHFQISLNSSFQKIFIRNDELILVGTDGATQKASVLVVPKTHFGINSSVSVGSTNEVVADALYSGDQLYVLLNGSASTTVLECITPALDRAWRSEPTDGIGGKSVLRNNDGSLVLCGESVLEGVPYIIFIPVGTDGTLLPEANNLRKIQGSAGQIQNTSDGGFILVGTTASTFGKSIQLIKSDKNYFMLKN